MSESKAQASTAVRIRRNLNPTREAYLAMIVWGAEYAKLGIGSMDFYDQLTPYRKRLVREWLQKLDETKAGAPDGLAVVERMYLWFLSILPGMPHYIARINAQGEMCALRDYIANATGRDAKDVQDEYELRALEGR